MSKKMQEIKTLVSENVDVCKNGQISYVVHAFRAISMFVNGRMHMIKIKCLKNLMNFKMRPEMAPGRGQNRLQGSLSAKNFFFRPEGCSNKPNAVPISRSIWKEVLLFLIPHESQSIDAF